MCLKHKHISPYETRQQAISHVQQILAGKNVGDEFNARISQGQKQIGEQDTARRLATAHTADSLHHKQRGNHPKGRER